MACDLRTGAWLEYHAQGLRAIKEAIELALRKYEQVPFKSSLRDTRGVNKVRAVGAASREAADAQPRAVPSAHSCTAALTKAATYARAASILPR